MEKNWDIDDCVGCEDVCDRDGMVEVQGTKERRTSLATDLDLESVLHSPAHVLSNCHETYATISGLLLTNHQ